MEHEPLLGFAFEALHALHVIAGTEGGGDQRLGFAASKDGGTVCAWQNADFDPDVADLIEGASIRTATLFRDLLAEDLFAQILVIFRDLAASSCIFLRDLRSSARP